MIDRLFWFGSGVVAGCVVTVRALHQSPRGIDLKGAALHTGSDVLRLAARMVRPPDRALHAQAVRVDPGASARA